MPIIAKIGLKCNLIHCLYTLHRKLYNRTMNEFLAKKLGEVLAFSDVGAETFKMGQAALAEQLGTETAVDYIGKCVVHSEAIKKLAEDNGVLEIVMMRADATTRKLQNMREIYVADKWDNAVELMEWSGFFEGAAIVHFALVKGAGEAIAHEGLMLLADEGMNMHHEMLDRAESELGSVGQARAV